MTFSLPVKPYGLVLEGRPGKRKTPHAKGVFLLCGGRHCPAPLLLYSNPYNEFFQFYYMQQESDVCNYLITGSKYQGRCLDIDVRFHNEKIFVEIPAGSAQKIVRRLVAIPGHCS